MPGGAGFLPSTACMNFVIRIFEKKRSGEVLHKWTKKKCFLNDFLLLLRVVHG